MVNKEMTIINPSGLQLKPAGKLSQTAMRYKSDIVITFQEKAIVAKSVLNVMAAGLRYGDKINIQCSGVDEEEALKAMCEAIESGLGEEK